MTPCETKDLAQNSQNGFIDNTAVSLKKPGKVKSAALLKLDLGCGQNCKSGFTGVDTAECAGVEVRHDLFEFPWPFKNESVSEVYCSHFFEHVPGDLRFAFMDEVYRVMVPGGTAIFIVPYYASHRAVQDPTHKWPPVCENSFKYFNKAWRKLNKLDHYPVSCDFDSTCGYGVTPELAAAHQDDQSFMVRHYINAVNDLQVLLTKRTENLKNEGK